MGRRSGFSVVVIAFAGDAARAKRQAAYRLLILIAFVLWLPTTAYPQSINFVQVTDPHLFDPGDEGVQNKAALAACVRALNDRMNEGADYKFAVITGDIGIENLVSHIVDSATKKREHEDAATTDRQLEDGATQLASILAPSKIGLWFFVVGNNDLFQENPDLTDYNTFIAKLQSKLQGLKIRDLSQNSSNLTDATFPGFKLIGFNNASFKNNNDLCRLWDNRTTQASYVNNVLDQIKASGRRVLIFYHIPEVDDPYIVLNADPKTLAARDNTAGACTQRKDFADWFKGWQNSDSNGYRYSSWFVHPDVVKAWKERVVRDRNVLGLFAGHLHDWRRDNYSGSLSKLYICPPLAVKLQSDKQAQARGFQEVTVDTNGRISRRIFWFDPLDQTFDTEPSSRNHELELALTYENSQDWQQAETHFVEAAKTAKSTLARNNVLAGLARVRVAQHSRFKDLLEATDPLISLGTFLLRVSVIGGILIVLFIGGMAVKHSWSALLVHPFDGDDELAKTVARRFPAVGAKVKKLMESPGQVILPANVTSIPFLAPPLEGLLPAEPFEVAGIKVPDLNVLLRWIVRPQFQITGGSVQSGQTTFVYAQIWRRQNWFFLGFAKVVTRNIPKRAGRAKEIDNFIYDIYLKANASKSLPNK